MQSLFLSREIVPLCYTGQYESSCHVTFGQYLPSPCVSEIFPTCNSVSDVFPNSAAAGPILQFKLSDIGEGIMEVTVKEWYILMKSFKSAPTIFLSDKR